MKMPNRVLSLICLLVAEGCAGDRFQNECAPGEVMVRDKCAVVDAPGSAGNAGTSGSGAGIAGVGGSKSAGSAGASSAAGGTSGAAGGSGSAGTGGLGGNTAGKGGGGGVGGSGAGSSGSSGAGGAPGGSGSGGAGSGGTGSAGTGAGGLAGSGSGAGGAGGTSGGGSGGGVAAGTGGLAGGGTGGAGAGGGTGGAGAAGAAGGSGPCDASQCPATECHVATCNGATCGEVDAAPGTSCAAGAGKCNGKGICGDCKPGATDCLSKVPRTCNEEGKWVEGTSCDISCGGGACSTVVSLASGYAHDCALLSDGHVRCWGGTNDYGELGVDSSPSAGTAEVQGISQATQLVAGLYFACARLDDASVWCWGDNTHNELARDTALVGHSAKPVEVVEAKGATRVFANAAAVGACAAMPNGSLLCWGNHTLPPATVSGVANVTAMGASEGTSCVRQANGFLFCWGANFAGQCATGTLGGTVAAPTKVAEGVDDVTLGVVAGCSRSASAGVSCWGSDDEYELGNGPLVTDAFATPQHVSVSGSPSAMAMGLSHVCVASAGNTYCWGFMFDQHFATPTYIDNVGGGAILSAGRGRSCSRTGPTSVACWTSASNATAVVW